MDTFALGLRKAAEIIEDGRIDEFIKERYASYNSGIGAEIVAGTTNLEALYDYAMSLDTVEVSSGRQEYLETIINNILFR